MTFFCKCIQAKVSLSNFCQCNCILNCNKIEYARTFFEMLLIFLVHLYLVFGHKNKYLLLGFKKYMLVTYIYYLSIMLMYICGVR